MLNLQSSCTSYPSVQKAMGTRYSQVSPPANLCHTWHPAHDYHVFLRHSFIHVLNKLQISQSCSRISLLVLEPSMDPHCQLKEGQTLHNLAQTYSYPSSLKSPSRLHGLPSPSELTDSSRISKHALGCLF